MYVSTEAKLSDDSNVKNSKDLRTKTSTQFDYQNIVFKYIIYFVTSDSFKKVPLVPTEITEDRL